jgi:hypothetical protein
MGDKWVEPRSHPCAVPARNVGRRLTRHQSDIRRRSQRQWKPTYQNGYVAVRGVTATRLLSLHNRECRPWPHQRRRAAGAVPRASRHLIISILIGGNAKTAPKAILTTAIGQLVGSITTTKSPAATKSNATAVRSACRQDAEDDGIGPPPRQWDDEETQTATAASAGKRVPQMPSGTERIE